MRVTLSGNETILIGKLERQPRTRNLAVNSLPSLPVLYCLHLWAYVYHLHTFSPLTHTDTSFTMSSTMADKLERLFGKKFGAARDAQSASRPSSPSAASSIFASRKGSLASSTPRSSAMPMSLEDMHFPQPSFIRPKVAKMVPREDHGSVLAQRPLTAGRSMSVPHAQLVSSPAPATSAAPGSLRVIAPASLSARGGATLARSPLGPPVSLSTTQARSMSVTTSRGPVDSRRSSFTTNNSSATLSSGCSTISSCNSSTGNRHSYVEAFPEISDSTPRTASENKVLANINLTSQRLPKRSSSLLQRRDLSLAPLSSFDDFQIGQVKRDSVTITINSGEISPATILQATPVTNTDSSAPKNTQPELKILGEDDLNDLHGLPELNVKSTEAAETPLIRRDSICAPIALPQSRPTSPVVSPSRRRGRLSRRPMSLRYKRHLPNEPTPSSPSSVLMEPNLGDFLSLSDDDIAEDVPASEKKGDKVSKNAIQNKPLPPSPSTSKTPGSPTTSPTRRRVLHAPSLPPSFQAPSPSFLALLPGMPTSAGGRPRTPAGDSRMAAAFEIASIASRYQFDLAYIATIWPKNMAYLKSSAVSVASAAAMQSIGWPSSPSAPPAMKLITRSSSQTSRVSGRTRGSHMGHMSQNSCSSTTSSMNNHGSFAPVAPRQSKLDAQFLAAFGLATVKTPYTLSAPMHSKILNAEQQWTEFSGPDFKPQEFSQGFGCAFHQGHAPVMTTFSQQRYERRPSTADDCDADTEQDYSPTGRATTRPARRGSRKNSVSSVSVSTANNRGIVFVAYRRKEVADERAARGQTDDLEALHRDIEALVQKIYDAHVQQNQAESQKPKPEVEDVVAASLSSLGPSTYIRQSRFLTVKATF
ncbi:hypothetical protein F503_02487 [Ophiostoma piceae UAMH 11346]|uniref:Uncharacterized protein n=1 Tax=Ophiostoma piceae (strain UAMH 11346) TaxID=1262450 RepID=S3BYM7_OPHP1|nr:hypothetical protein F503_02487 [Ophiostoma piceae UAMH 11346]